MDYKIQNIIASAYLNCRLDVKKLADQLSSVLLYKPGRFPGLIIKIANSTVFLFSSGKITCNGVKTEHGAKKSLEAAACLLLQHGYVVSITNFKIHNFVASCKTGCPLDLRRLHEQQRVHCMYEIELFPALYYRIMSNPKITAIIFSSGKIIITGAKHERQITRACIILRAILSQVIIT